MNNKKNTRISIRRAVIVGCIMMLANSVQADPDKDNDDIGSTSKDWPRYGHDYGNTNWNPGERKMSSKSAKYLRRAWETFNDDRFVSEPRPTGFVLESMLNLVYRSPVVG
ncbi:MAG: hypothetical protein ACE5ET_02235, partial [Gammaproteobacteria bacterium]